MMQTKIKKTDRKRPAVVRAVFVCAISSLSIGASAAIAEANIPFGSSPLIAEETCTIVVQNDGAMTVSPDGRTLSSQEAGGVRGAAIVRSQRFSPSNSARFEVSVDAPSGFDTAPANGNTGVNFETRMHATSILNGITMNNRNGNNPRRLRRNGVSVQEVTIDLIARKPVGQAFPIGNYSATTVLRCE